MERAGTKRKVAIPRWPIWLEGLGDVQVKAPSRPVQGPVWNTRGSLGGAGPQAAFPATAERQCKM